MAESGWPTARSGWASRTRAAAFAWRSAAVGVDHQDPRLQLADDVVVHLLQVGEVDLLAADQALALMQAQREPVREHRDREIGDAEQAGCV